MASDAGEKTEAPTGKRRGEARKRGQVPKSADLSQMVVLFGLIMALHGILSHSSLIVKLYFQTMFQHLDTARLNQRAVIRDGGNMLLTVFRAAGPLVATGMLIGIAVNIAQTGPLLATESLRVDLNRLNPLNGLKRLFSPHAAFTLGKSFYKIGLIGYIAYITIRGAYPQLLILTYLDPQQAMGIILGLVYRMALRITVTMLILATLDYFFQRYQLEKSLKMSKEEVKQEMKQQETSPQVKGRIRARQRQIAKKRMMAEVPLADVVVANPTHFAVALKYEPDKMNAPTVVAKGQDLIALKIRELAQQNDVPIVENPPLARTLYRNCEIGREIPGDLYEAVAEVLAFVYRVNEERRARQNYAPAAR
jgi:flagellar biosynthetic protein FlhB